MGLAVGRGILGTRKQRHKKTSPRKGVMDTMEKAKGAKPLLYRLTVMWKQC